MKYTQKELVIQQMRERGTVRQLLESFMTENPIKLSARKPLLSFLSESMYYKVLQIGISQHCLTAEWVVDPGLIPQRMGRKSCCWLII